MKSEWAFKTKDTGEHMKKTPSALLVGAVVAVLAVLALLVAPVAARATSLSVRQRSEAEVEELVEGMLSAGDYVEGEVLVCYLPDAEGLTAQASFAATAASFSRTLAASAARLASRRDASARSSTARICAARSAALAPPFTATVATGMPVGI